MESTARNHHGDELHRRELERLAPAPVRRVSASKHIYASVNGGSFTRLISHTLATSATVTAQAGHTYGFYSVATNNLGLVQAAPTAAHATITVTNLGAASACSAGDHRREGDLPAEDEERQTSGEARS